MAEIAAHNGPNNEQQQQKQNCQWRQNDFNGKMFKAKKKKKLKQNKKKTFTNTISRVKSKTLKCKSQGTSAGPYNFQFTQNDFAFFFLCYLACSLACLFVHWWTDVKQITCGSFGHPSNSNPIWIYYNLHEVPKLISLSIQ